MITVQTLIDATPMYRSLSEKAQARFRKRLAKRLHKFFSKSGAVIDSLDDVFLSRFEVTADNAKKVTNLAGGIFSFSWLALPFGPFWAAYKRAPAFVGLSYLDMIITLTTLWISWNAYASYSGVVKTLPLILAIIVAMFGRGHAISLESKEILEDQFGMTLISPPDRWMATLLGPKNRPWVRVAIFTFAGAVLAVAIVMTGSTLYGDVFYDFNPFNV